jgi:polysaccharide biosynthesis PFTS motif protein
MEDHPENILLMNYFGNDIFLDEAELPKEDVLFIVPWERDKIDLETRKKFNCVSAYDGRDVISSDLYWNKIMRRFIPAWFKSILFSLFENPLVIKTNTSILLHYILWNVFLNNYGINNYVKKLNPDDQAKIHILSQHGVKTWFVYPDNTTTDYFLDWEESKKNQTLFSFLNFDYAVVYGNTVERYFKKHRNNIKRYVKTGVLWSQIACELQEGKLKSPIFDIVKERRLPGKIVGVFDTTPADYGPYKIRDAIRFGNDILKLLDEMPDIGIVFKAVKRPESTPYLASIYDRLKNHERCLLFYPYNKEGISAVEVVTVSDLVVSAAYTSPTAEALGARKKAIYYDVAGHDIGDKYYFNRFQNFVAHNYEELKKLVKYWLYEIADKEFDDFLNKYVKDEIDPYLDGKALTRLRKLLMEDAHAQ